MILQRELYTLGRAKRMVEMNCTSRIQQAWASIPLSECVLLAPDLCICVLLLPDPRVPSDAADWCYFDATLISSAAVSRVARSLTLNPTTRRHGLHKRMSS